MGCTISRDVCGELEVTLRFGNNYLRIDTALAQGELTCFRDAIVNGERGSISIGTMYCECLELVRSADGKYSIEGGNMFRFDLAGEPFPINLDKLNEIIEELAKDGEATIHLD
jgi:hypothetical protein